MPVPNDAKPGGSATGDFDGDSLADFALAFGPDTWAFSSNGAAPPTQIAVVSASDSLVGLVVADFDADGLDDIAFNTLTSAEIHLNQGTGFSFSDSFTVMGEPALYPAEVNGDGSMDLMKVNLNQIDFFEITNGQLTNQTWKFHGLGGPLDTHPICGDVDGDGDDDVVAFRHGNYRMMRRTGPASFTVEPTASGGPATMLADVDGDGDLDGVCCSSGGSVGTTSTNQLTSFFEIALNDGTGGFADSYAIETCGSTSLGIAGVADLDHDGDADLIGGRSIYYAGAEGLGEPRHADIANEELFAGHAVDADGDGDIDFSYDVNLVEVNSADGWFQTDVPQVEQAVLPYRWRGPGYPGDFDGDGDVDMLVSRITGTFSNPLFHDMHLLVNNGVGSLADAGPAADPGVSMNVSGVNFWWDEPKESLIADLDADGDLDYAARSFSSYESALFFNDGSGYFSAGPTYSGDVLQHVADLDADGIPDLVFSGAILVVRWGLGGGAFGHKLDFPNAKMQTEDLLGLGDLNNDGNLDLAMVDRVSQTPLLFYNDGSRDFTLDATSLGSFKTDDTFALQRRVFITDVDLDGLDDLLVTAPDNASNATWIFRQLAGGTLDAPVAQIMRPTHFVDVDADGDLDVIVDDFTTNNNFPGTLSRVMDNRAFDGSTAGRVEQYGTTKPGTGGQAPLLGASGPLRVGETVVVHLTGLQAGNLGIIGIGLSQSDLPNTPFLGVTGYSWPWFSFVILPAGGAGAVAGDGALELPYHVDASFPSVGPIYVQGIFADQEATAGRTFSNGLLLEHE